jgi:hypothetical protein
MRKKNKSVDISLEFDSYFSCPQRRSHQSFSSWFSEVDDDYDGTRPRVNDKNSYLMS